MHRDQKIGLALAVLIIGFAGAFCFRHEPLAEPRPLTIDGTAAIDARIEQLPMRTYIQSVGVGSIDSRSDTSSSAVTSAGESDDAMIKPFGPPPEPLRPVDARPLAVATPSISAPAPPRETADDRLILPVEDRPLASTHQGANAPRSPSSAEPKSLLETEKPTTERPSSVTSRTYVVQSGDTLSDIALQMYGHSSRYLDLYRANTDKLHDPNDLPIGVALRIPDPTTPRERR